jgi:hypothetical protein
LPPARRKAWSAASKKAAPRRSPPRADRQAGRRRPARLKKLKSDFKAAQRKEVVDLVGKIARQVIRAELALQPTQMLALVDEALAAMPPARDDRRSADESGRTQARPGTRSEARQEVEPAGRSALEPGESASRRATTKSTPAARAALPPAWTRCATAARAEEEQA